MNNLFKNFRKYKLLILFLFMVLMIQAYCDMSLPRYTQDIIDTGIQNHGIEHLAPEKVTAERFGSLEKYMDEEEKDEWEKAYRKDGDSYVLQVEDKEKLSGMDDVLLVPLAAAFESEREKTDKTDDVEDLRKQISETAETVGTSSLYAEACAYVYDAEKEAGVDVDKVQTSYLWKAGRAMVLMAVIMFLAAAVVAYYASKVGADIGRDLRNRVFARVMAYSNAEMDQFSTASLITRCTNDVQQIQLVMTMILRMLMYAPVMCIWGMINVARAGSGMEWIIMLGVIAVIGLISLLLSLTIPKFKMMQQLVDALNRVSREILTGLSVIRAFGSEKMEEARFDKANTDLTKTQLFTNRVMSMMQPAMMLLMNGLEVLILAGSMLICHCRWYLSI